MKKIASLFMVMAVVSGLAFAAGNKNDLAYVGFNELQATSSLIVTDELAVFQSDVPTQGTTISDVLALSSGVLTVESHVDYSAGAGALPVTADVIYLTTAGAEALTLADGVAGQRLTIVMVAAGGAGTVTPANFANGTTLTFDAVGETAVLSFDGTNWYSLGTATATIA